MTYSVILIYHFTLRDIICQLHSRSFRTPSFADGAAIGAIIAAASASHGGGGFNKHDDVSLTDFLPSSLIPERSLSFTYPTFLIYPSKYETILLFSSRLRLDITLMALIGRHRPRCRIRRSLRHPSPPRNHISLGGTHQMLCR